MEAVHQNKLPVAYKLASYFAIFCFLVYWFITSFMIAMPKTLKNVAPKTFYTYNVVIRQNWHLFSNPSVYNKHVLFVLRDKKNHDKTDTLNITKYFINERIARAPFNNYYDNLDHVLYRISHYLEGDNVKTINQLKKQDSLQTNLWYIQQSCSISVLKNPPITHFTNLIGMCKQVLVHEKINTAGKEYQLLIKNNYIPPHKLSNVEYDVQNGIVYPCFITPFYSF